MNYIERWFNKEVYKPRVIIYLGLSQLAVLGGLILFTTLQKVASAIPGFSFPRHSGNGGAWSSTDTVAHYVLLSLTVLLVWMLHLHRLSVEPHLPTRRIQWLTNWLLPHRLLHLAAFLLSGALAAHCFLVFALNSSPWFSLGSEGGPWHWDERHWFVVGAGAFSGLLYGWHYYATDQALVRFPIVQVHQARVLKSRLLRHQLPESLYHPVRYLHWYYLSYWFFLGSLLEQQVVYYLGVSPRRVGLSWGELLNPGLLATTWLCASFLHWLWNSLVILAQVLFSQRFQFIITSDLEGPQYHYLQNCLSSKDAYVKHLAFLDLKLLAQSSPDRRKQVFSISPIGGAPRHWPAISAACLSAIQDFLKMLEGPAPAPPKKEVYSPADLPSPHPGMRKVLVCNSSLNFSQPPGPPSMLEVLRVQMLAWWKSLPVVKFFLLEMPEVHVRRAYSLCQPVVWAVEALSFLVAASRFEDQYGVVQRTLPEVLSTLLNLQMVLDKAGGGGSRSRADVSRDLQLQRSVKHNLSMGLCHLTQAFGHDLIHGVKLSEEHKNCLKQYLDS